MGKMRRVLESLAILEEAMGDCVFWRWWTARGPDHFQVEFSGVRLHEAPASTLDAPSNVFALSFGEPEIVELLEFAPEIEGNWFERLAQDEISPFRIRDGQFVIGNSERAEAIRGASVRRRLHVVGPSVKDSVTMAFETAEGVGLFLKAKQLRLFSVNGEIPLDRVEIMYADWWAYWKRYWGLIDTANALPYDWRCEIDIPAGEDEDGESDLR